jgi:uncharacterized protein YfaS (alpha-2-macroglobulin family)
MAALIIYCNTVGGCSSKSSKTLYADMGSAGAGMGGMPGTASAAGTGTGMYSNSGTGGGVSDDPIRVRKYFPETLFNEPSLITDAAGHASISLDMADSITDWRLTALANSLTGKLGSVTEAVRCFQEFFVDINLPVQLTQNDEMHVPCVLYNYLETGQQVQIELQCSSWFTPLSGTTQVLDLSPNEVRAVYFPIRVDGVGSHAFTVFAYGQTMSDAISRTIRVLPDGEPVQGTKNAGIPPDLVEIFDIPTDHIPGADDCYVKLYAGYVTQVIEGMESLIRLPCG